MAFVQIPLWRKFDEAQLMPSKSAGLRLDCCIQLLNS